MPEQPDFFRDFGISPQDVASAPQTVRAYFSGGRVFGQFLATFLMSCLGIGMIILLALNAPFPANITGSVAVFAAFAYVVYLATRHDYVWVELDGNQLRAKHLYTGRIIQRSVEDIDDLLTMVIAVKSLEVVIVESLLGRVRGVTIRFRDQRTPITIMRADPAMTNARELIEAVIYRMSQHRPVDAEVINLEGKPLVRRIHWKKDPA